MLKIRFQIIGRKRMPVMKLVVAEHTAPIQGKYLERLGGFIPGRKDTTLVLEKERIAYWVSKGAKPSQTVARLLVKQGMKEMEKFIEARPQKKSKAEIAKEEAAIAAAEAKKQAEEAAKAEAEAKKQAEAEAKAAAEATPEAPAETPAE